MARPAQRLARNAFVRHYGVASRPLASALVRLRTRSAVSGGSIVRHQVSPDRRFGGVPVRKQDFD